MSTFPVRVVCFRRKALQEQGLGMSSQQGRASQRESGEDVSELGASSASVVTEPSSVRGASSNTQLKTVWDFEKIERRGGPDANSKCWHCGWCGITLKGWNATKALNHVSKASGNNDVKACTAAIPKTTLSLFQSFRYQKMGAASVKRQHKDALTDAICENQMSIAVMFEGTRNRQSNSAAAAATIDMTGDNGEGVGVKNATRLTSAIAEFVYSKGLSFSATEGEHFMQILKLSRLVSNSYRPPTRKALSNELLDLSYEMRLEKYMKDLDVDAEVYGLSLFGDGATVHGMPLMNILASGVGEPSAVLAIVDCKCVLCAFCLFLFELLTICFLFAVSFVFRYGPSR
jgi:hypothetical protein